MTVADVKNRMLDKLAEMDLDSMTLMDANLYADVLKKLSDINEKSYTEIMADVFSRGINSCSSEHVPVRLGASASKEME